MNLTELSISRAGRSSTRTEGACLGSSLKIARRGPQGWGTAPKIQSWTVSVTPDAPRNHSWTVSVTPDAPRNPFSTPVLNGDAPQDRFSRPDDPRWEIFGLNIPSSPRAPTPATGLSLSLAGDGRVLAEWTRGTRSDDNRIFIQVVGVDEDYREYGKSGNVMEAVLKDLPAGAVVKVKIIALNGSLEAVSGPEAQISMPV